MPRSLPRSIQPFEGGNLITRARLILRLLRDRRVHPLIKLIPVLSLAYLFIPDLVIGPLDDAAVVWLGMAIFVELCPPEVVAEHWRALVEGPAPASTPPEVIEGEFREIQE
ncbi:hypothetical protein SE15_13290 [Thermanaerothrix daxensis]|uniref:DUF1232 domain-containing protein n=1 Tax=Thermanaerothrix daxensis TaxID=869279 RepID=A0A0P6YAB4_9CHLR|nr:hypothetical protein [Thermanaerothrix daxensis]KPL82077.1 hypothetical protein SE15_13290 [Thermanaerothrix daxensis]